jgi:hypothetical protein
MNKLLCVLTAGAAALVLTSGFSSAADKTRPNVEPEPRASENQPGDPGPVMTAPDQAKQDQDYMAALKKCDSLTGGQKQKCVEAAQKKFNRM